MKSLKLVVVALVASVGLVACSGLSDVSQEELEKGVAKAVKDGGKAADSVTCDGALKGEVGAEQDCTIEYPETMIVVRAKATKVTDDEVLYEMTPLLPSDHLADTVQATLAADGHPADEVTCDGDLIGEVGKTQTCTVTAGEDETPLTLEVNEVNGFEVAWQYVEADEPAEQSSETPAEEPEAPEGSTDSQVLVKSDLEMQIMDLLEQEGVGMVDAAGCPGDLEGVVGTTMVCNVSAQGLEQEYVVTVTEVTDAGIGFSLEAVA